MARDRKPIPKNQSQITQGALNPPYLPSIGKPDSSTVFTQNRSSQLTRKNDKIKDISIGLEDIDFALMYYFKNVIKPTVIQDGNRMEVHIMYGSPERWQSVQADGYYRDTNGKAVFPLIMYKRTSIEKNRSLGNKLDGNNAALFQTFETRYNQKNQYDKFSLLTNRIPPKQYYVSVVPDYVTVSYDCVLLTNFVEQNNKLIEAIEFASDSYWGDFNRWHFRTSLDSFGVTTTINTGEDRISSTTVSLKVNGYLIPDNINKDLADSHIHYSPARIIFGLETVEGLDSDTFTVGAAPKTAMGGASFADSYNVNLSTTTVITGLGSDVAAYLAISVTKYASTITSNTAVFNASFAVAPAPLTATSVSSFTFFVNGQLIDANSIVSFVDNGDGTCTLTVNPSNLQFSLDNGDQIVAIGKFA